MIPLDPISKNMLVAKGLTTTREGINRFGLPGIAVESNEELKNLDVDGIEYLMILSDRDNASQAAAYTLAARMDETNRKGRVYIPKAQNWPEAVRNDFEGEAL